MEVMVLVGLVIYGGYRLIKASTPAARRERKRLEEQHKQEIAANKAIREATREKAITDYMNAHNVDRESAMTYILAEERRMAAGLAQQAQWERYKREYGEYPGDVDGV